MFADADHEVIDSPEALFRHLYEEHGVEEARDLDPETAPLQFWLRRHADLERAQRAARRQAEPPGGPEPPAEPEPAPRAEPRPHTEPRPQAPSRPQPQPAARSRPEPRPQAPFQPEPRSRPDPRPQPPPPPGAERRPARFGDPLVEAVARALAGRGHDEAAVRAAIRSFAGAAGKPAGEAAVRAAFVEPMLQAAADRLLGTPAAARSPSHSPTDPTPSPSPTAAPAEEPARPEAAWAVLWADLAESRQPGGDRGSGGEDGDDLMAVANAVQQQRRVRLLRR
jgi:hypothetical protein